VLAYLSRYTHRIAISNWRLPAFDETGAAFRDKDYRRDEADRQQVMTLGTDEFIRRFLLHVLPRGFHRIRRYGLLASSARKVSLARGRELLTVASPPDDDVPQEPLDARPLCPCFGGHRSSSRHSSASVGPVHHRTARSQPGGIRRVPARPARDLGRSTLAAANDRVRAIRRQRRLETPSCQRSPPPTPSNAATIPTDRITFRGYHRRS
jgi:hypothetical protein